MKNLEETSAPIAARFQMISRSQLHNWPGNPRTFIDEKRITELRASMKARGFDPAFPLIVRPVTKLRVTHHEGNTDYQWSLEEPTEDGQWREVDGFATNSEATTALLARAIYEIAAGQRRFIAAGLEDVAEIPCSVREMDDRAMLDAGLIENVQHETMTALEEGRGYARLMAMGDTNETIAARLGMSASHVRYRVSLVKLEGTSTAAALESGAITPSHARLLASVPSDQLRDELLQKVLRPTDSPGPLPVGALEKKIKLDYMKELRGTLFARADANLVPVQHHPVTGERIAGGSCEDCPLLDKSARVHLCLNPECLRMKEAAEHEQWRCAVSTSTSSVTTLAYEANKAAFNEKGNDLALNSRFVKMSDAPACDDELKRGVENVPTWKKILRGQTVPIVILRTPKGDEWEVIDRAVAIEAAREGEKAMPAAERIFKTSKTDDASTSSTSDQADSFPGIAKEQETEKQRLAEARARELALRVESAWKDAVREGARKMKPHAEFAALAIDALIECVIEHSDEAELLEWMKWEAKSGEPEGDCLRRCARKLEGGFQSEFLVVLILMMHMDRSRIAALPKWAKLFEVDLKAVKKTTEALVAAEHQRADEEKAIGDGVVWKERKEKAEDFKWNTSGLAENPDRAEIALPKAGKVSASVSMARDAKGWHVGWFIAHPKWGTSSPCDRTSTGYSERPLALRAGLLALEQQAKANKADEAVLKRLADTLAALALPKKGAKK